MGTRKTAQPRRGAPTPASTAEPESATVRLYLRRSVGRGGFYYGPGWADVPKAFAKSLIAGGAITESSEESEGTASGDATGDGKSESAGEAPARSEEQSDVGTEATETENEKPAARKRSAKPAKSGKPSKSRRK